MQSSWYPRCTWPLLLAHQSYPPDFSSWAQLHCRGGCSSFCVEPESRHPCPSQNSLRSAESLGHSLHSRDLPYLPVWICESKVLTSSGDSLCHPITMPSMTLLRDPWQVSTFPLHLSQLSCADLKEYSQMEIV